jgi:hypothetical protein
MSSISISLKNGQGDFWFEVPEDKVDYYAKAYVGLIGYKAPLIIDDENSTVIFNVEEILTFTINKNIK